MARRGCWSRPSGGVDAVVAARDADVVVFAASVFPGAADLAADRERHDGAQEGRRRGAAVRGFPIRRWDASSARANGTSSQRRSPRGEERIGEPIDLTPDAGIGLVEHGLRRQPGRQRPSSSPAGRRRTRPAATDFGSLAIDRATRRAALPDRLGDAWYAGPACLARRPLGRLRARRDDAPSGRRPDAVAGRPGHRRGPRPHARARPVAAAPDLGARRHVRLLHRRPARRRRGLPASTSTAATTTLLADDGAFTDVALDARRRLRSRASRLVRRAAQSGAAVRRSRRRLDGGIRSFPELDDEPGELARPRSSG